MKLIASKVAFLATALWAISSSAGKFPELEQEFAEAISEDAVYDGTLYWGSDGHGTFCDTYDDGELDFNLILENVDVDIDSKGVVDFNIQFAKSYASIFYEIKNGIVCKAVHARGEVQMSRVEAVIKLIPAERHAEEDAKIRLPKLQIAGLSINKVYIGTGDHEIGGDLPDWANQWLESNFNSFMAKFLKTQISERLTDVLIKKLEDMLRDQPIPHREPTDLYIH